MKKTHSPKLIYLLSLADRQVKQWMKTNMPRSFPSPTQAGVLFVLNKQDGLLIGEIGEQLQLAPSSLSGLIQRMEDANLIQRQTCYEDARATRIYLTAHSKTLIPELIQCTHQFNQQLQDDFSAQEMEVVERWLKHIAKKFP